MHDASTVPSKIMAETVSSILCLPDVPILPGLSLSAEITSHQLSQRLRGLWENSREVILVPTDSADVGCLATLIAYNENSRQAQFRGIRRIVISPGDASSQVVEAAINADRAKLRMRLVEAFLNRFPEHSENPFLSPLWERELSFGALCDLFAYCCQLSRDEHTYLLGEFNEDLRCELVLKMLTSNRFTFQPEEFPPPFSLN